MTRSSYDRQSPTCSIFGGGGGPRGITSKVGFSPTLPRFSHVARCNSVEATDAAATVGFSHVELWMRSLASTVLFTRRQRISLPSRITNRAVRERMNHYVACTLSMKAAWVGLSGHPRLAPPHGLFRGPRLHEVPSTRVWGRRSSCCALIGIDGH